MLGRDHALAGALTFLVVGPAVLNSPSWQQLGVGVVVGAGAGLVSDLDEPGSTVSRRFGPISQIVSEITKNVSGGHRNGTHSLLFAAMAGAAAWFAWWTSPWSVAILVAASFFLVFRMLLPMVIRHVPFVGIASVVLMFLSADWAYHLVKHGLSGKWLVVAVVGGVISHLVCDSLTVEGVPIFYLPFVHPLQRIRIAVPLVGHTGSARESLIGSLMGIALVWMALPLVFIPGLHAAAAMIHHDVAHFNLVSLLHLNHALRIKLPALHLRHRFFSGHIDLRG